jgi:hypothetical protein
MSVERLEIEQATAYYDAEQRMVRIAYRGSLGSDVTVQVYDWLDKLIQEIGVEKIHGEIFDFSGVTEFQPSNLQTARKTSKRLNVKIDTSQLPVALIAKTFYQEEILRGSMQISPDHTRKRIVKSEDEAFTFIHDWNATHREKSSLEE